MSKYKLFLKEASITIVLTVCLTLFLQIFVVEARVIPTGSMLPTININQRVLVNKLIYKLRQPKKGEIIVFSPPINTDDNKDYIKRVIALPGDIVEIKNGKTYVNNEILEEYYIYEQPNYELDAIKIPSNSLFVLGDNRNKSYDSHAWDIWLQMDEVKGKAFFIYWPLESMGTL